ncbi:rRNA maturation RNase YbeY [Micrococcus sp. EYE_162]|uniref:rRNA maturation RNase YbeY n=1 Tax=unclassified Micrococcus TaxID=2620948 RepID=UPI002004DBC5|nr:rRNA maturation RNase YbeY [Micrococcus sp. EYE_212]MCK6170802.1 rRNA maturation RNase YbeY [Micrococcus sp. EYE_162]
MAIEIVNESGIDVPERDLLGMARHVYARLHVHELAETAVTVVDADRMAQLHEEWMDLPGPTDVMSLPMDEITPGAPETPSEGVLGDVVLCPEVAAEQAARGGHTRDDELMLLLTHGMLHLLGYDHMDEEDRVEMFELQDRLVSEFLGRPAPAPTIED